MLLLWLGSYPKPIGVLHLEETTITERQMDDAEFLLMLLLEEDTLTLEDTWQVTSE
jgi:hypothetical protein